MNSDAPPGNCRAWLESVTGTLIPLSGNCSFGRSSSCTVVIRAESASRQHATIHAQDADEFWLIDLGSSNGTHLNDLRVSRPTRLQAGDRIQIAHQSWTFQQRAGAGGQAEESEGETMLTVTQLRRTQCWLLLADIEQFTPLSQRLDPETLAALVGKWLRASREILDTNGGMLNKYLGDGFLAFWRDEAGTAEKIVAALAAFSQLQAQGVPRFRVVLHRGEIILGGAGSLGEESLLGSEVNYIFRLEKLAGGLKVPGALSEAAAARLGPLLPVRRIDGEHPLKGFEGNHRLFAFSSAS